VVRFVLLTAEASTRATQRATTRALFSIRQLSTLYHQTNKRIDRSRNRIRLSDEVIASLASVLVNAQDLPPQDHRYNPPR